MGGRGESATFISLPTEPGRVGKREDEKKRSLAALRGIAEVATRAFPEAPRPRDAPRPAPGPAPQAKAPPPAAKPETEATRARRRQQEERREKLAEERALRERRGAQLRRSSSLEWRGMDLGNVPAGIRRTAFDRAEPSVSQKIEDVLGAARLKESREKMRDKGRRQGGR